jgi:hypothetical protein
MQLWHHQLHIIAPLAAVTGEKTKWYWGPEQKNAFCHIRNVIAKQVVLKYPDFSQPFDIYFDDSSFQLGSVISQND